MIKGIYKIENIWDGKVYIGESNDIETRWQTHKEDLNNNKHHSYKLQEAWNKDGEISFVFEIIQEIENNLIPFIIQCLLFVYEDKYIKQYDSINNGYNVENTLLLLLKGDKPMYEKYKMTTKMIWILKEVIKNIEKNNGIYIPSKNVIKPDPKPKAIKEKKPNKKVMVNIEPKPESMYKKKLRLNINFDEFQLTAEDIKYIKDKCSNYKFKEDYEKMSDVFINNGLNVTKTNQLLRDIGVLEYNDDNRNICLINDNSMFGVKEFFFNDKETGELKSYFSTSITEKGFNYLLDRIFIESKNKNVNIFTHKLILEVKTINDNIMNNINNNTKF